MKIEKELRPCIYVNSDKEKKKALFHCWSHESNVIGESLMVGGHPGGQISCTLGIIELENGEIVKVYPSSIKFVDNKIKDYCFERRKND